MGDSERLREVMEFYKMSTNSFGKYIELSTSQILYDILRGRNGISKNLADKITAKCLNINKLWLLTGEGEMVSNTLKQVAGKTLPKAIPCLPTDADAIPLLQTSIEAGVLSGFANPQIKSQLPHYIVPGFKGADFLATVSGESMIDRYWPGDVIGCKIIDHEDFIQWGKTHILDTTQGGILKKIMPSKKEDYITAISFNSENYPPFDVPKKSILKMAIVIGIVRLI